MSRAEAQAAKDAVRILERVVEELRVHGVNADIARDPRGGYDIYIDYEDLDVLDRLCAERRLSPEAEELLC